MLHYGKLGDMLKPLVPKFYPDLSAYLKDIANKTGPHEAETDTSIQWESMEKHGWGILLNDPLMVFVWQMRVCVYYAADLPYACQFSCQSSLLIMKILNEKFRFDISWPT